MCQKTVWNLSENCQLQKTIGKLSEICQIYVINLSIANMCQKSVRQDADMCYKCVWIYKYVRKLSIRNLKNCQNTVRNIWYDIFLIHLSCHYRTFVWTLPSYNDTTLWKDKVGLMNWPPSAAIKSKLRFCTWVMEVPTGPSITYVRKLRGFHQRQSLVRSCSPQGLEYHVTTSTRE